MNYEYRIACLSNAAIAPCTAPMPAGWQQRFHMGDRVRMRPTRIVTAEYSPIPSGTYGTLVGVHTSDNTWGDPDNRSTRPLEIEWDVAGLGLTLGNWFPIGQLRAALDKGYPMYPHVELQTVRWWMHPCHIHITRHNKTGYPVATMFAQAVKWANHPAGDKPATVTI
jgi:hypothetical protein